MKHQKINYFKLLFLLACVVVVVWVSIIKSATKEGAGNSKVSIGSNCSNNNRCNSGNCSPNVGKCTIAGDINAYCQKNEDCSLTPRGYCNIQYGKNDYFDHDSGSYFGFCDKRQKTD